MIIMLKVLKTLKQIQTINTYYLVPSYLLISNDFVLDKIIN